ncbi:MAG: GMC oxidoreductase [Gemmatimonadota bacterium]
MFDVAVYGSGFAGFALATRLVERGKSVLVVERGPRNDLRTSAELARIRFPWEPVESGGFDFGVEALEAFANVPRFQGVGGTSMLWSGKWRTLDSVDFARRMGERGWPFDRASLEPHDEAVARRFGFSLEEEPEFEGLRHRVLSAGLRLVRIALPKSPVRLAGKWLALEETAALRLQTDAREIEFAMKSGRILSARCRGAEGHPWFEIEANTHVVAAGGIASTALVAHLVAQAGTGNRPFMGGYMDHPKGEVGQMRPRHHLDDLELLLQADESQRLYAVTLPEEEIIAEGMGNHTIFLWSQRSGASGARRPSRSRRVQMVINAEQFPEPWNGVSCPDGNTVRWRISGETRRDVDRFLSLILPRLEAYFGPVTRARWIPLRGASHPAGCTPYSTSPAPGELHPDGRIEGIDNAFCASSSGFPFAGSANPTLTVAALADRLASRLSSP